MRKAKDTLLSATSPRLTQRTEEVYKIKDKRLRGFPEGIREPLWRMTPTP